MGTLNTFLSEDMVQRIGWVLVHFLWQGVAVMVVVMVMTMDVLPSAVGAFRGRLSAPAYRTHQTTSSSWTRISSPPVTCNS